MDEIQFNRDIISIAIPHQEHLVVPVFVSLGDSQVYSDTLYCGIVFFLFSAHYRYNILQAHIASSHRSCSSEKGKKPHARLFISSGVAERDGRNDLCQVRGYAGALCRLGLESWRPFRVSEIAECLLQI